MSPRGRRAEKPAPPADQVERDEELAAELEQPAQPELPEDVAGDEPVERPAVPTSEDAEPDESIGTLERTDEPEPGTQLPPDPQPSQPAPAQHYRVLRPVGQAPTGAVIYVGDLVGGAARAAVLLERGAIEEA